MVRGDLADQVETRATGPARAGAAERDPGQDGPAGAVRGRIAWFVRWRVRRSSGIDEFHVHQMRHTFACQWLERGGSLAALQQVLGHASIVTTQRYAKLTDEAVMREAARLAERGR